MFALVLYSADKKTTVVEKSKITFNKEGEDVSVLHGKRKYKAKIIKDSDNKEWLEQLSVGKDGSVCVVGETKQKSQKSVTAKANDRADVIDKKKVAKKMDLELIKETKAYATAKRNEELELKKQETKTANEKNAATELKNIKTKRAQANNANVNSAELISEKKKTAVSNDTPRKSVVLRSQVKKTAETNPVPKTQVKGNDPKSRNRKGESAEFKTNQSKRNHLGSEEKKELNKKKSTDAKLNSNSKAADSGSDKKKADALEAKSNTGPVVLPSKKKDEAKKSITKKNKTDKLRSTTSEAYELENKKRESDNLKTNNGAAQELKTKDDGADVSRSNEGESHISKSAKERGIGLKGMRTKIDGSKQKKNVVDELENNKSEANKSQCRNVLADQLIKHPRDGEGKLGNNKSKVASQRNKKTEASVLKNDKVRSDDFEENRQKAGHAKPIVTHVQAVSVDITGIVNTKKQAANGNSKLVEMPERKTMKRKRINSWSEQQEKKVKSDAAEIKQSVRDEEDIQPEFDSKTKDDEADKNRALFTKMQVELNDNEDDIINEEEDAEIMDKVQEHSLERKMNENEKTEGNYLDDKSDEESEKNEDEGSSTGSNDVRCEKNGEELENIIEDQKYEENRQLDEKEENVPGEKNYGNVKKDEGSDNEADEEPSEGDSTGVSCGKNEEKPEDILDELDEREWEEELNKNQGKVEIKSVNANDGADEESEKDEDDGPSEENNSKMHRGNFPQMPGSRSMSEDNYDGEDEEQSLTDEKSNDDRNDDNIPKMHNHGRIRKRNLSKHSTDSHTQESDTSESKTPEKRRCLSWMNILRKQLPPISAETVKCFQLFGEVIRMEYADSVRANAGDIRAIPGCSHSANIMGESNLGGDDKIELQRNSGIFIDKDDLENVLEFDEKPRSMVRRLMSLIVGDEALQGMSAGGRSKRPGIPKHIRKVVLKFVRKNKSQGTKKFTRGEYTRTLNLMCSTLRSQAKAAKASEAIAPR